MPVQSITPTSYKSIVETTRSCPPSSVCSVCKSPDYVDDQRSALSSGCTFESIHVAHLLPRTQAPLPDVVERDVTTGHKPHTALLAAHLSGKWIYHLLRCPSASAVDLLWFSGRLACRFCFRFCLSRFCFSRFCFSRFCFGRVACGLCLGLWGFF